MQLIISFQCIAQGGLQSINTNPFNDEWQVFEISSGVCPASITDIRDGEVYAIVEIRNQCWMAENLCYNLPETSSDIVNSTSPSNPSGVQGVCPGGWHLPSDSEWNELEIVLGMAASDSINTSNRGVHASAMKSMTG